MNQYASAPVVMVRLLALYLYGGRESAMISACGASSDIDTGRTRLCRAGRDMVVGRQGGSIDASSSRVAFYSRTAQWIIVP